MYVTISGATGLIGRYLIANLTAAQHSVHVLSRGAPEGMPAGIRVSQWDPVGQEPPPEALEPADAVVHLAGESVAQPWSKEVKEKILRSRIAGTRHLVQAISTLSRRPTALVCASAIGIYGSRGDEVLTESSAPGEGFLADVCTQWEREADLAEALGMRVVKMRIGIVLAPKRGALARMLPPFKMFLGGRLGSGQQWMSWIHVEDLADLVRYSLEHAALRGPVNGTAPNPVRNAEFAAVLGSALHRPSIFPVPALLIRTILGEMSEVVLGSQRALPQAAQSAGFQFRFPALPEALREVLSH